MDPRTLTFSQMYFLKIMILCKWARLNVPTNIWWFEISPWVTDGPIIVGHNWYPLWKCQQKGQWICLSPGPLRNCHFQTGNLPPKAEFISKFLKFILTQSKGTLSKLPLPLIFPAVQLYFKFCVCVVGEPCLRLLTGTFITVTRPKLHFLTEVHELLEMHRRKPPKCVIQPGYPQTKLSHSKRSLAGMTRPERKPGGGGQSICGVSVGHAHLFLGSTVTHRSSLCSLYRNRLRPALH